MKKLYVAFTLAFGLLASGQVWAQTPTTGNSGDSPKSIDLRDVPQDDADPELTTITFNETSYDFGEITQGDVVKHTFTLTNSGDAPLKLESVKPSCGCTALDWPKDPIAPGESAEIKAQFNSAGKMGAQTKYITIVYNGNPNIERISFKGTIVPKPAPDSSEQ